MMLRPILIGIAAALSCVLPLQAQPPAYQTNRLVFSEEGGLWTVSGPNLWVTNLFPQSMSIVSRVDDSVTFRLYGNSNCPGGHAYAVWFTTGVGEFRQAHQLEAHVPASGCGKVNPVIPKNKKRFLIRGKTVAVGVRG